MSDLDFDDIRKKIAAGNVSADEYAPDEEVDAPPAPAVSAPEAAPVPDVSDDNTSSPPAQSSNQMNPAVQDYLNKLVAAQAQTKKNQEATGLTGALVQLTHGISRAPGQADLSAVKALGAGDTAPTDNLNQQLTTQATVQKMAQEQAALDPNSQRAQNLRAAYAPILVKAGIDPSILKDLNPSDQTNYVQKIGEKLAAQKEANAQKDLMLQFLKQKQDTNAGLASRKIDNAEDKDTTAQGKEDKKEFAKLTQEIDPNGSRTGNFGKAGLNVMNAQKVQAILSQFPDGNVPKAQTEELATAAAALIGGGSVSSQAQLNAIVPASLRGKFQEGIGWLLNQPAGLQQQEFIKNLGDSAAREKAVAEQQIDQIRAGRIAQHYDLAHRAPEDFKRILKANQMDPDNYDFGSGQYIPKAIGGGGKIRVSNGSDTRMIDPKDLLHAQSDGYKRVQ